MSAEEEVTQGVQSLYSGVNHGASWERSYNADGRVYCHVQHIRQDWEAFLEASHTQQRRRAVMRCYISRELLPQLNDLPIEAAVPMGNEYLIWIGQNQHSAVSTLRDVRNLPIAEPMPLPPSYVLDTEVRAEDAHNLVKLWQQFGWTAEAIQSFISTNANGNPIVLIRTLEQEAIGVMIAESAEFGARRLVEITELAVNPYHRGNHLATILIRELSRLSLERWADALVFGEYNLTTRSYYSAAHAGQVAAQTNFIDGVLREHVGIETGPGNEIIEPWGTQWLHNFLVMYQLNQKLNT
jgi:hypothetical protein